MNKLKWYNIQVTPIDEIRSPYNFRIETSNLDKTMDKYTRDKEGIITALWKIIRQVNINSGLRIRYMNVDNQLLNLNLRYDSQ